MDDYLDSVEIIEEARNRISQIIEISKRANWEMHSWASNIEGVVSDISVINNPTSLSLNSESNIEKILGLQWNNISDILTFRINSDKISNDLLSGSQVPTKREFLSVIMSISDPLGLLTPFTIRSKILMQDVQISKIGWDQKLKDREFSLWMKELDDRFKEN